ncbi:MAG: LamG-like jellyroll fold domain-containing protein, partial [Planctomycetota bacterium]
RAVDASAMRLVRRLPCSIPLLLALVCLPASISHADPPTVETSRPGARVLPLPKGDDVFHFAVFGDRTGGRPEGVAVLRQAVRDTNLLDPDLVMTVGDLINGYNRTEEWLAEAKEYRAIMGRLAMPWYPVAGNHDIYWRGGKPPEGHHEANYEQQFGPLWYSFRHKGCVFVVLYSDEGDRAKNRKGWRNGKVNRMSEAQLTWLRATLEKAKDARHVFVFLHHPRWISDFYPDGNWDAVHGLLKANGNVRAVIAGHIHRRRYDGKRDGIDYMTMSVVGGHTPYLQQGTGWLNHFNVVTVRKDRVSYATIPVGATLDPKAMTPAHWAEVDALRSLAVEHDGVVRISPKGDSEGEYAIKVTNPTKRPIDVVLGTEREDRAWWFTPDHAHARLEPGASRAFRFRYARLPRGTIRPPRFALDVDYLGPTQRVTMPTRALPARLRLVGLDDAFWTGGTDHALRLGSDRAAVRIPPSLLFVPDGPFTVEGWVKAEKLPRRIGVLAKTERSEFGLFLYEGTPSFEVHLDGKYQRARSREGKIAVGEWIHVAGVFDGSEVRIYVNGKLTGRKAAEGKRTRNALPFLIGADPDRNGRPGSSLPGWIDEVRVSKVARYEGESFEPQARFAPDDDTLLLMHFDRLVGTLYPDHSPKRVHGVPRGPVSITPRNAAPQTSR